MGKLIFWAFLFIGCSFMYGYFLFKADEVTAWEIRYYVFITIAVFMVFTFAVLRLYNAVVANTKFLIMVNQLLKNGVIPKIKSMITNLEKPNKILGGVMGRLKTAIDNLTKVLTKPKNDNR